MPAGVSGRGRVDAEATADEKKRGMGTTLVAMLFLSNQAFIIHVGDSRGGLDSGRHPDRPSGPRRVPATRPAMAVLVPFLTGQLICRKR